MFYSHYPYKRGCVMEHPADWHVGQAEFFDVMTEFMHYISLQDRETRERVMAMLTDVCNRDI